MRKILAALAAFFVCVSLASGQGYPQNNAKRIWGLNIAIPAAGDDGQFLRYNHATGYTWETAVTAEADTLATVTGRGATTDTAVGLNGGLSVDTPAFVVANATGAVSTTAMPTVAVAGGNAPTEALQITHTTPAVAAEMAATLAVSFDFVNSIDSGAGQEEAARIEVYKWGDWFNVAANDDDDDAGLKVYTTENGDQTLRLTVGDGTSGLNVAAINPAGGSATAVTINPTLGIMDGSDTWYGVNVAPTNSDHTGASNTVTGVNIGTITGDADATETALSIGAGWDVGLSTASRTTNSAAGAASAPAMYLTGAPYTGGTGTTTFPLLFAQPTGATAGTSWSTSGTMLGINAADAFTGYLIDMGTGGTSKFTVRYDGIMTVLGGYSGDRTAPGMTIKSNANIESDGAFVGTGYYTWMTADAAAYHGQVVMPSTGTPGRWDLDDNTGGAFGVYAGTEESESDFVYAVATDGIVDVVPAQGVPITLGIYLVTSGDFDGYVDTYSPGATGMIVGKSLSSEDAITISQAGAGGDTVLMSSAPGWEVGDWVVYWEDSGTPITGLTPGMVLSISSISTDTIQLRHGLLGDVVDIVTDWAEADGPYLQRLPKVALGFRPMSGELTTVVTVRDSGGSADCTMTFAGGVLTSTTCSHT